MPENEECSWELLVARFGRRANAIRTKYQQLKRKHWKKVHEEEKTEESSDMEEEEEVGGVVKEEEEAVSFYDAQSEERMKCTLLVCEGQSAASFAHKGLSVLPWDLQKFYGVYPLKGKPVNVRKTKKKSTELPELQHFLAALGLERYGKERQARDYSNDLRFGRVMLLMDADEDGSHIKGLIINIFAYLYPSLFRRFGFLVQFTTPVVTTTKKGGDQTLEFYTWAQYQAWQRTKTGEWRTVYHKGLGGFSDDEAKRMFCDISARTKMFVFNDDSDSLAIEKAFSTSKGRERKEWINSSHKIDFLDDGQKIRSYSDFVDKELILFARIDLSRSIPSLVDGLKTVQRKILFGAFKMDSEGEGEGMKVAQFAGYVSGETAYRHGERGLAQAVIGMAQTFVGSNNINLLFPHGQFGSRMQCGKDSAAPRYSNIKLGPLARYMFREEDDRLLNVGEEDGQIIEPEVYVPVLPMVLINGAHGVATGWSTSIPNYNPRDVAANVERWIDKGTQDDWYEPMLPWYRGFEGKISSEMQGSSAVECETYSVCGKVSVKEKTDDESSIEITELPISTATVTYRKFLKGLIEKGYIKDYKEHHDDKRVRFIVTLPEENLKRGEEAGLLETFQLKETLSTRNMHLFSTTGQFRKYSSCKEIMEEFCSMRLDLYEKRLRLQSEDEKGKGKIEQLRNKAKALFRQEIQDLLEEMKKQWNEEEDLVNKLKSSVKIDDFLVEEQETMGETTLRKGKKKREMNTSESKGKQLPPHHVMPKTLTLKVKEEAPWWHQREDPFPSIPLPANVDIEALKKKLLNNPDAIKCLSGGSIKENPGAVKRIAKVLEITDKKGKKLIYNTLNALLMEGKVKGPFTRSEDCLIIILNESGMNRPVHMMNYCLQYRPHCNIGTRKNNLYKTQKSLIINLKHVLSSIEKKEEDKSRCFICLKSIEKDEPYLACTNVKVSLTCTEKKVRCKFTVCGRAAHREKKCINVKAPQGFLGERCSFCVAEACCMRRDCELKPEPITAMEGKHLVCHIAPAIHTN